MRRMRPLNRFHAMFVPHLELIQRNLPFRNFPIERFTICVSSFRRFDDGAREIVPPSLW
jgi:hypothetical protein